MLSLSNIRYRKPWFQGTLPGMEDRIIALETKVAYLEHALQELNDVVVAQQKNIAERNKKLDILVNMFRELKDGSEGGDMPHVKPPHY